MQGSPLRSAAPPPAMIRADVVCAHCGQFGSVCTSDGLCVRCGVCRGTCYPKQAGAIVTAWGFCEECLKLYGAEACGPTNEQLAYDDWLEEEKERGKEREERRKAGEVF